jgi:Na+/melibiose symporter-like transporter
MMLGTPIACTSAWFLVSPPPAASPAYLAIFLILFYFGWTLVFIPHQSWGGEISEDYQERTRIAGYRETLSFVGYLMASVAPLVYWKYWRGVDSPTFAQIVQAVGAFFIVTLPVGILVCQGFAPRSATIASERMPSWREFIAILGRNDYFARLSFAYIIDRLALGLYFTVQPFFVAMVLDLQEHILTVAIVNTIAGVCLAPLWVPIARRVGKHRAYVLAIGVTFASFILSLFAPPKALALFLVAQVLMGFGNAGTLITPAAMAADTVDHDELRTGARQMGGHMAFLAIIYKGGIMLGAPVALALLSQFEVEPAAGALSNTAAWGVRLCASLIPAALLLVPILVMWRFPLDEARHATVLRDLTVKRQQA